MLPVAFLMAFRAFSSEQLCIPPQLPTVSCLTPYATGPVGDYYGCGYVETGHFVSARSATSGDLISYVAVGWLSILAMWNYCSPNAE